MSSSLHYYQDSGRWAVLDHDDHPIDYRCDAVSLLKHCDRLPKDLVTLLVARRFELELRQQAGFFGLFLSDSGVIAPNAHAALRRLHLSIPAGILAEAMHSLGPHYPQRFERRRAILMGEWNYDAPHGPLTTRLRDLTREFYLQVGGPDMPLITDSMRNHIQSILRSTTLGTIKDGA